MLFWKKIFSVPRNLIVYLISFYQKTLSPDHGFLKNKYPHGFCRYYPSCSQYSKQAFGKYGIIKGGVLSLWRILRCNPWSRGGEDELK